MGRSETLTVVDRGRPRKCRSVPRWGDRGPQVVNRLRVGMPLRALFIGTSQEIEQLTNGAVRTRSLRKRQV